MTTRIGLKTLVLGLSALIVTALPVAAQSAKTERLTDDQVVALIGNAKTPADHEALAAYYRQTATDLERQAGLHKRNAVAYRRAPATNQRIPSTSATASAAHCDRIAAEMTKAAAEAKTMADHHAMLAKEA